MVQQGCVECFELGGREHIQGEVASAGVGEVLDVVGDGYARFLDRGPGLGVEQFGLHPTLGRLDEGIVVSISDDFPAQS